VNKGIQSKDVKAFNTAYAAVVADCNNCHKAMGYGFVERRQAKGAGGPGPQLRNQVRARRRAEVTMLKSSSFDSRRLDDRIHL